MQDITSFEDLYKQADDNIELFWANQSKKLAWISPWKQVLDWQPPYAKWFIEGKLNISINCLDRHLKTDKANQAALIWKGEPGESKTFTYRQLHSQVCKFANCLKNLKVKKGDLVAIYLPLIPEAIIAMLACSRIGAIHTVIFGGFSTDALKDRLNDAEAKLLITADGGYRKGALVPLKLRADQALLNCPNIKQVIVIKRTSLPTAMQFKRDYWYHDLMLESSSFCLPEAMDSEDPLFILYTSGTTGKPKGIIHSTAGYLLGVTTSTEWVFNPKPQDIFWCTADIGWITGHSYVAYGPLALGLTEVIYEGSPDFPNKERFWKIIEEEKVSIFYTAPTAIRTFMRWGQELLKGYDLSSLRLLGSVGEPINPEAWQWYYHYIGQKKCPIVDTWWQTETGSILIAPLLEKNNLKPGSAHKPLPGIRAKVLNEQGEIAQNGYLALTYPWPSMLRGIYKDDKRYRETYWQQWQTPYYFTGDGARLDEEKDFWLLGRVDDVINVSGHRLSTIEIESALVALNEVAEAAVIGIADEIKGQAIIAFVTLKDSLVKTILEEDLKEQVVKKIGTIARPKKIYFTKELPKTRSGKIMRRLLRDIAHGKILGDTTTLADPCFIEELKEKYERDELKKEPL